MGDPEEAWKNNRHMTDGWHRKLGCFNAALQLFQQDSRNHHVQIVVIFWVTYCPRVAAKRDQT